MMPGGDGRAERDARRRTHSSRLRRTDGDLFQDDQDLGRTMARKHGSRFGWRDIFAGGLRIEQGRRLRIANSSCSRRNWRPAEDCDNQPTLMRMSGDNNEKARGRFIGYGPTTLSMLILCQ